MTNLRQKKNYWRVLVADKMMVLLVVIALSFPTAITLWHSQETSPIDEWVFVDYTSKVFEQGYVREGERVGNYTVDLMACHGVLPGSTFGTCGADDSNYEALPYTGLTAAAAYTPIYFFATRILGLPFQLLGADPLTAWRLTGGIWLALGIAVFVSLLRAWGVSNRRIFPLALLIIASPFVWWAHTFVSTDAPAILVGASILLLATKMRQSDVNPWWFLPIAVIAVALKVTNLVSVGLAVLYLLVTFVFDFVKGRENLQSVKVKPGQVWKTPVIAIFGAIVAVGVQVIWAKFIAATAVSAERVDQGISIQLTPKELALQVVNFIPSVLSYSAFSGHGKDFIWVPLSWIPIAGVIGSFFLIKKWNEKSYLVVAILVSGLAMAPLLAIAVQIAQGAYFQLSPRYGASLIPAFMLTVAFILRNKAARGVLLIYAVGLFSVGIYAGLTLT